MKNHVLSTAFALSSILACITPERANDVDAEAFIECVTAEPPPVEAPKAMEPK